MLPIELDIPGKETHRCQGSFRDISWLKAFQKSSQAG
jgi:hypothetical protein